MNSPFIMVRGFALLVLLLLVGGCASLQHNVLLTEAADNNQTTGIRYYQSAPYVLVYKDSKGAFFWKLYYLPDQTRVMVAEPHQLWSKITANMTFANGVLTESGTDVDATAVAKGVVKAVGSAVSAGLVALDSKGYPTAAAAALIEGEGPWLWRVKVEGEDIKFLRDEEMKARLAAAPAK